MMKKTSNQVIQRVTDKEYSHDLHKRLLDSIGLATKQRLKNSKDDHRQLIIYLNSSPKANAIFWMYKASNSIPASMADLIRNMTETPNI